MGKPTVVEHQNKIHFYNPQNVSFRLKIINWAPSRRRHRTWGSTRLAVCRLPEVYTKTRPHLLGAGEELKLVGTGRYRRSRRRRDFVCLIVCVEFFDLLS